MTKLFCFKQIFLLKPYFKKLKMTKLLFPPLIYQAQVAEWLMRPTSRHRIVSSRRTWNYFYVSHVAVHGKSSVPFLFQRYFFQRKFSLLVAKFYARNFLLHTALRLLHQSYVAKNSLVFLTVYFRRGYYSWEQNKQIQIRYTILASREPEYLRCRYYS